MTKRERESNGRSYDRKVITLSDYKSKYSSKQNSINLAIALCTMFNHYEQIKVNLKGLLRGETRDATLTLT
jgi:hypothetical protein